MEDPQFVEQYTKVALRRYWKDLLTSKMSTYLMRSCDANIWIRKFESFFARLDIAYLDKKIPLDIFYLDIFYSRYFGPRYFGLDNLTAAQLDVGKNILAVKKHF